MSWNYRLGTKVFSYEDIFKGKNEELAKPLDTRLFSIIEVYYDDIGNINTYSDKVSFKDHESIKDIKHMYELINIAFTKPIIDLDNFPNEWNSTIHIIKNFPIDNFS